MSFRTQVRNLEDSSTRCTCSEWHGGVGRSWWQGEMFRRVALAQNDNPVISRERKRTEKSRPFGFAQGDRLVGGRSWWQGEMFRRVATRLLFTQGALLFACFIFRRLLLFTCENENIFLVRVLPLVAKGRWWDSSTRCTCSEWQGGVVR